LRPLETLKAWMEKRKTLRPHQPVVVKDAAFLKNASEEVDLARFPAPTWHRHDGGPFHRLGLDRHHARSGRRLDQRLDLPHPGARQEQLTVQFDHGGRHGAIIAKKYWDQGKPCPLAVVNGEDPALFIAGFEYLPAGQSEYEFAGAIKGAPIEVYPGPLTGLPIPAHAEIVFEGISCR
jgi:4-hydroxy-3-polyprenylbenzoate decarboxylase